MTRTIKSILLSNSHLVVHFSTASKFLLNLRGESKVSDRVDRTVWVVLGVLCPEYDAAIWIRGVDAGWHTELFGDIFEPAVERDDLVILDLAKPVCNPFLVIGLAHLHCKLMRADVMRGSFKVD
jgi:hypothetical protein